MVITGSNGSSSITTATGLSNVVTSPNLIGSIGNKLTSIDLSYTGGGQLIAIYGIYIDGKLLTTIPDPDEVKIISKDEDAGTITVDGGDWAGSDGSGDAW